MLLIDGHGRGTFDGQATKTVSRVRDIDEFAEPRCTVVIQCHAGQMIVAFHETVVQLSKGQRLTMRDQMRHPPAGHHLTVARALFGHCWNIAFFKENTQWLYLRSFKKNSISAVNAVYFLKKCNEDTCQIRTGTHMMHRFPISLPSTYSVIELMHKNQKNLSKIPLFGTPA